MLLRKQFASCRSRCDCSLTSPSRCRRAQMEIGRSIPSTPESAEPRASLPRRRGLRSVKSISDLWLAVGALGPRASCAVLCIAAAGHHPEKVSTSAGNARRDEANRGAKRNPAPRHHVVAT